MIRLILASLSPRSTLNGPIGIVLFSVIAWLMIGTQGACSPWESNPRIDGAEATPNVVLIISDDQAWTDYGFMGHPEIQTPNLDRLASESLVYPHGYVPSSLCSPSLATILSGLFPHQHKITGNDPPLPAGKSGGAAQCDQGFLALRQQMIASFDTMPSIARMLSERGYLSLQTGKWWGGNYRRGGFTNGMTHGDPARGGRHGDEGLTIGRQGLDPIRRFLDQTDKEGRPFLIWYAPFLPHTPHNPPERHLARYREHASSPSIIRYWAMCSWFDETCGELLDELEARDLDESTIVIYVCDNGWIQNPDGRSYAPRSKRSPYDGGIRTPIMIRWPSQVVPRTDLTPVSSVDIAPTILQAVGLPSDPQMTGIDLLDPEAVKGRESVPGAIFAHNAVDIDRPSANLIYRWIVHDGWKLILPQPPNAPTMAPELYKIEDDPNEHIELADQHPEVVEDLIGKLDAWWTP